jgi:hypothetical protein
MTTREEYEKAKSIVAEYEIRASEDPHFEHFMSNKGVDSGLRRYQKEESEPYFGWCEVEGCVHEGSSGGACWRDSGYWTVCHHHSSEFRKGAKRPEMKRSAVERENSRGADGILPIQQIDL